MAGILRMWSPRYAIARDFDPPDKTLRDAVVAEWTDPIVPDPAATERVSPRLIRARIVARPSRIGNVDNDPTLDVWTISSESRQAPDGMSVPPGSPRNDVNDVIA
jgi:hypothetical protein